jgi:osmotically-inducible protein OsmY
MRVTQEVQKKLGGLTNFSVFDWITFGFHGKTLVLKGYASRPILKSDAGNAVKGIAGIESVDNQIEVLPNSPNDDRIRAAVYNRIYTQPTLAKYNANQGSLARALGPGGRSVALMAGGITNDPPIGFHAIHIIVKNGNVALYGVVNNEMDKAIAGMQANSAPGAFSVENDLIVQGAASQPKAK